jgi:pheromone shutdown protein TraB
MLEMDEPRYSAAISSIVEESQMTAPSRVDIISTVQGGLLTRELKSAVEAAREVEASIYLVDRPYRITQNRLAEKVLNPYVFSNLFVYGKLSLMNSADDKPNSFEQLEKFLRTDALPIYKVLIEERAQYMAQLIHEQARDGETTVIVCSKLHVPIIQSILSDPDIDERLARNVNMTELSRKGLPLWPVLVGIYFVLPISLMVYLWTMVLSGVLGVVKKVVL